MSGCNPGGATTDAGMKRPRVTVKLAQTLDGRIATRTGHSQWISGEASRALAHELRATHDAVMVGIGTVLRDDPRLTVRLVAGRDPLRVVADSTARIPLDSHLLADRPELTVIAIGELARPDRVEAIRRQGARVLLARSRSDGRIDLADLFGRLSQLGVRSVMVEGGAAIVTSLLQAQLVDRVVICIAPKLVGAGVEAVGDLGILHLDDAVGFEQVEVRQLGDDIVFDGRVAAPLPAVDATGSPPSTER